MGEPRQERAIKTMRPGDKLVRIVLTGFCLHYLDRRDERPGAKSLQNPHNPIVCRSSGFVVVVKDADAWSAAHWADVINPHFKDTLAEKCIRVRRIRGR